MKKLPAWFSTFADGGYRIFHVNTRRRAVILEAVRLLLGGGEILGYLFSDGLFCDEDKLIYLAHETTDGEVEGVIVKYCFRTIIRNKAYELWVSPIPEGYYQLFFGMPDKLLKLLTPTTDPDVLQWRCECAVHNALEAGTR